MESTLNNVKINTLIHPLLAEMSLRKHTYCLSSTFLKNISLY